VDFYVAETHPQLQIHGLVIDGGVARIVRTIRTKPTNLEMRATLYYSQKYGAVIGTDNSYSSATHNSSNQTWPLLVLTGQAGASLKEVLARYDSELAAIHRKTVDEYLTPKRPALLALISGSTGGGSSTSNSQSLVQLFGQTTGLLGAYAGILHRDPRLTNMGLDLFAKASGLPGSGPAVSDNQAFVPGTTPSTSSAGNPRERVSDAAGPGRPKPAPYHPNPAFEYRWMNGKFVAPYTSFPSRTEANQWQCYSKGIDINCSFDKDQQFSRYEFIFRRGR
jgi:hypothetical protein